MESPIPMLLEDPEVRHPRKALCTKTNDKLSDTSINLKRHGSWERLVKAVADAKAMLNHRKWKTPPLDTAELEEVKEVIIKLAQASHYSEAIKALKDSPPLKRQSSIVSLTPFLDKSGIMRIGGRASKSLALSFEKKHPLILPESADIA